MIRSILTLTLVLALATEASAQTAPATKTAARETTPKTTTRTKAAMRQPTRTARPATITSTGTMADLPTSTKGQTQSIYAAPGQPIVVPEGKVGPYDGKAAGRHTTKGGTTLSPR
ncbi:hypothetical protein ACFP2F_04535 [Hymenobacter artigasi]|uniref:Topoisomerase IA-like protein n=1 Tax=Hymenobacter artigasi TaxID=2719616 RepID=A0ABX1HG63_9BACT|nr:hypothetical protein [Hymenobacter artigasi]NKI88874.1 topoisomerase IA-like protein [Hymenobacter artigasi]